MLDSPTLCREYILALPGIFNKQVCESEYFVIISNIHATVILKIGIPAGASIAGYYVCFVLSGLQF